MNSEIFSQFKRVDEYQFEGNDELNQFILICNLIKCKIDDAVTIISDDIDDHNDLVELVKMIYEIGELDNPPFTSEFEIESNRVVKIQRFRLVITQSSNDFIQITLNHRHLNKLAQQILP